MNGTITLTALQARRALQLARWMTKQGGDQRTRLRCHDLVRALESALGATTDAYKEQRRAEWVFIRDGRAEARDAEPAAVRGHQKHGPKPRDGG
jgi:hypothetical protein